MKGQKMARRRFVCSNHINWLKKHNSEIVPIWNNATEQGIYFQDRKMWNDAISPLGCAYEMAEIYLELQLPKIKEIDTQSATNSFSFDRERNQKLFEEALFMFSSSTKRFLFTLIHAEQDEFASHTVKQTVLFLERLKKQKRFNFPEQFRELRKTLNLIEFSKTDYELKSSSRFVSPSPSQTPLTIQ